jgi:hypothetical protein
MVIPAAGGTALSLAANEPASCAGDAFSNNGRSYYFLIFSSARKYGDEFSKQFKLPPNPLSSFKGGNYSSQLYLAAIVVDSATGQVTTYPAVYIWNQNRAPSADGATALQSSGGAAGRVRAR